MKLLKKIKLLCAFLFTFALCFGFSHKVFAVRWIGSGECYRTWYINVNKPIDPATVTSKNVMVYDDNNNQINVPIDVYNSTSIRIRPNDKGYTPGHKYSINLASGIKSIYGDSLNLGDYALNYFTVNQDSSATISDSTLEKAIRVAAKKPSGTLMQSDLDRVSELNISDNYGYLSIDFSDIEKLHNLNKVTFYNSGFSSLSNISSLADHLKYMKSFYALDLSNNSIGSNISQVLDTFADDNVNIRNIDLSNTNISDISHLNRFANLNTVDVSNNKISNVYSIGTLNLREANLSNNYITDISNLRNNNELTKLNLSSNNIVDLSPLSPLTNLVNLDVSNNGKALKNVGGYDISPLSTLVNLETLNLNNDGIQNIDSLEDLDKMKDIDLSNNGIQDINGIENMAVLQNLNLSSNYLISDISVIKNLENIVSIDLSGNSVRDLSALKNLSNLTNLNLEYNKIVDVTPLQDLLQLQKLRLNDNKINNVYPLISLTNLNTLYIKDNDKFDTTPLTNLVNVVNKDF